MSSILPPPPIREIMQGQNGIVMQIWSKWFTQLYKRVVGYTGQVTLTVSVASTVVLLPACQTSSLIFMFPATSAAATTDSGVIFATAGDGSFTVSHANSATAGRIFNYLVQV